jgi:hypothetical protein
VKRLLTLTIMVVALFSVSASISSAKLPIGTQDTCASVFTADASACGGTVYLVYYIAYHPNQTAYSLGQRWCEYHWSNGVITNSPC